MKKVYPYSLTHILPVLLILAFLLSACSSPTPIVSGGGEETQNQNVALAAASEPTVEFTLTTGLGDKGLAFIGQGGEIDGVSNPDLKVEVGDVVKINLVNGDGAQHDIVLPDLSAASNALSTKGETTSIIFTVDSPGEFVYYCSIPGHQIAGMEGYLIVEGQGEAASNAGNNQSTAAQPTQEAALPAVSSEAADIIRLPDDLPGPLTSSEPQHHVVDLESIELDGMLADGTSYTYWTFNGKVPGPFLRIRVGDTVDVNFTNAEDSTMVHSVDFHAVTGPGGGAAVTQAAPGETKSFSFKALNPGLYVYHCATPMVAHHITNGMYGLILVEPEGGLEPVDREFYVMQGELYTTHDYGTKGHQGFDVETLMDEQPEYFVFNGAAGALTQHPLTAKTGETVRIFFGVGGPNFVSSFHVIGEIFDRVYDQASLTSAPLTDVQTTLVPPGGATVVEFTLDVPGRFILVDHALSRAERGLAGHLVVEGEENPETFHSDEEIGAGH